MTELHLSEALHRATDDIESRLDPATVWEGGHRRRRRTAVAAVGLTAASVVALAAVAAGLPDTTAPSPAPGPTAPTPTSTDAGDSPGRVSQDLLLPGTDPADWADLPPWPGDLGSWSEPERPESLAEDPVTRATTALQYELDGNAVDVRVIGEDGRWRSIDTSGLDLDDGDGGALGLHRGSLSPDGTRLALGVRQGIAVVDLTTAEITPYDVPGLVERWGTAAGRNVFWSADGSSVLLSQHYWATSRSGSFAYPEAWRVDLPGGEVSRVPYDPEHAALLDDGSVVADRWSESQGGHTWVRWSASGEQDGLDMWTEELGVLNAPTAHGDLWVARRELTYFSGDRAWDRSGFAALDGSGQVVSVLPVKGVDKNGGGGAVVGWLDETVVLISMPNPRDNVLHETLAWDVLSGELWRGPSYLQNTRVSLPAP